MTRIILTILLTVTCTVQGSVKKGVVHWADSYECDDFKVLNNMTWWYDFRMNHEYYHTHSVCSSTIETYYHNYVPMVWGFWKTTVINLPDESHYVFGFNEPNHMKQSNMSPEKAAAAWKEIEKHGEGKQLVSPSAAPCGSNCRSNDIEWFDKFFDLCKDCRVDYLAAHTYWCNPGKVMDYLERLYKRYKRKIWLTEFACSETEYEMEQLEFMEQILPELEAADFIFRYSWYSARIKNSGFVMKSASLLKPGRSDLTTLGSFYNNFQGTSGWVSSTTVPILTTKFDIGVVGREETLFILQLFTSNPIKWWRVLNYMKKKSRMLSPFVRDLYKFSPKKELKERIKKRLNEVVCTDPDELHDLDIRELVKKIQNMPEEEKKKSNKGSELRVPRC